MKSLLRPLLAPESRAAAVSTFVLTVLQALFGPLDLHASSTELAVGMTGQVMVKLAISGLVAIVTIVGIYQYAAVRAALLSVPAIMLTLLLLLTVVGGFSGTSVASIPASMINCINIAFVIVSITVLGLETFCFGIVCGIFGTATYGLYLFYFNPASGVFLEPLDQGQFLERLGGMAHPNSVARSALIASLLTLSLYRSGKISLLVTSGLILLDTWNAVLAVSRTAMIGGMLGLLALYSDQLRTRLGLALVMVTLVVGTSGLFALFATGNEDRLVNKLVGLVSKNDDTSELTTGTGRTVIWTEAVRHIAQRPLFGYGLNVGPVLLENFSQATHNAILHATLSGGLLAGGIMICFQVWTLWQVFSNSNLLIRSLSAFLFISSLTEDTVLETFPGPCTMMWFACCIVPVMKFGTQPDQQEQARLVSHGANPDIAEPTQVAVAL